MRKTNKKSFDWYGLKQHFSIRKYHFGAASVLLGMSLALGTGVNTVSAAEAVGPDGNVVALAPTDPNAGTPVAAPLAEDAAAAEPVAATEAVTGDTSAGTEVVPVSPELQEVVNEYDTTRGQAPNDTTNEVLRLGSILDTKLDELVAANPTTPGLAEYVDKVKKAYPEYVTNEEKAAFVTATDFAVTSELNQILENYDSKIQVLDPIQYGPTATTQEQYEALKADAAAEYQKQLADKNAKIEAYKADLERYYADVEAALAANEEGKPSELITKNSFIVGDESLATIANITINDSTTEYLSYIQYRKEDMTVAHPLASPDGMQGSAVLTNPVLANRGAKSDAEVASSTFDLAADVSKYPYASGFNFAVKDGASITVEYSLTGNSTIEIDGVPTPIDAIRVTYTVTNTAIAPTDPKPWSSYTIYRDPRYGAWLNQAGATNDNSKTIHTATYEVIVDGQVVAFPADTYTTGSSLNIGEAMTSSGEPIYINGSAIKTTTSTVGDPAIWETSTSNNIIRYTATNYDKALNPNVTSDGRVIDSVGPIPFGSGFIDSDGIVKRWDDYTSPYAYKGRVIYEIPLGTTDMSLTHYGNGGGWLILFADVPTYEIKPVMDFVCEIQPYFVAFETTIKASPQESAGTQGQPQTDKIVSGLTIVPEGATTTYAFEDGNTVKIVPSEGSYSIDETGTITFTPEANFVGTATPLNVVTTATYTNSNGEKNSISATTTYTPTVYGLDSKPDTTEGVQGQVQESISGAERFTSLNTADNTTLGDPQVTIPATGAYSFDDGLLTKTVDGKGAYTIDPDTGVVTFTPLPTFTGTGTGVTVRVTAEATDSEGNKITVTATDTYTPSVTPVEPTADDKETIGKQGQEQTQDAKTMFTAGDPAVPIDQTSITLLDENNQPTTVVEAKDADGNIVGVYTLDTDTGVITFSPNSDFVGTPVPVTVQAKDTNGTPVETTYTPTVTPVTPVAFGDETTGLQGQSQTSDLKFKEGDPVAPVYNEDGTLVKPAQFIDPITGQPTDVTTLPALKDGVQVGTYTLDPTTGQVVFQPNKDFTGTPDAITVQVTDKNGTPVTATYTPTVTPVVPTAVEATSTGKQGQPQTGTLTFTEGDPVAPIDNSTLTLLDENGQPAKEVPAKDENGKEVGTYVLNEDGTITFTPNPDYVGTPVPVTVQVKDANGTPVETTYSPIVTPVVPTAVAVASVGLQGKPQTGTPVFTEGDAVAPIDNTTVTLLDENGQPAKEVPAKDETGKEIGTYVLNEDGSITFTPNPDFFGTPVPAKVQAKDANGTPVETTYSPKVIPVTPDSDNVTTINVQGAVQTNTPTFTPGSIDLNADGVLSEDEIVPVTISADNPAKFVVDGQVVEETTIDAKDEAGNVVGTYTVDPTTGEITFTPNPDFVGTPVPATLQAKDVNGTPTTATYTPTVIPVTPVGSPAETEDIQGATQTGKPTFTGGSTVVNNEMVTVPIDETVPATFDDGTTEKVIPGEGTYTVAPDGTVTFVPEKDFVGTAQGVTVKRVDTNGTPATATYTPTVTPVTPVGSPAETEDIQGATQSGKPSFTQGHDNVPMDDTVPATFEDGTTEKVIPGEGTYTVAPDGTVTFVPEKDFTGTGTGVTVVRQDVNGTKATAKYTPTVTPVTPTGSPVETTDKPGVTQSGKPVFTQGHNDVPMDDTVPATFDDGTTEKVIPGEGTYTVAPDGIVTFVPEKDFIGTGTGVTVVRQDVNGTKATAKYTPTVTPVETKWVDEYGNPLKDPTSGATPNEAGEIPGYVIVSSTTDENGNVTHVFKQLETSYVDENGNPLKTTDKGTLDPAEIKGYYVSSTTTDKDGNVTHVYLRISTTFVDEEGNELSPKEDGPQSSKDIPAYTLVGTEIDENGNVKHIYKKSEVPAKNITTEWLDENGNPLKDPTTGETPETAGSFEGYEFVGTTTDENGNVKHVFKKVVEPAKTVTTEWLDENGNPLKDPTTGETPETAGSFDGYEFVGTTTDENGNVKHVFKKVVKTTTNWVDENGNPLKPQTDGSHEPGVIPDYEFVGTATDANGNVIHVFRKTAAPQPEAPEKPGKPTSPSAPAQPSAPATPAKAAIGQLPNTGESTAMMLPAIGASMLLASLALAGKRRREQD